MPTLLMLGSIGTIQQAHGQTTVEIATDVDSRYGEGNATRGPPSPSTAVLAQDTVDIPPVFLHGADPYSWDGKQLLGCSRAAGS